MGALALSTIAVAPAQAGATATVKELVPVFTEDFTPAQPLDAGLSVALERAEARAETRPTELAPPYVSEGRIVAPTTADTTGTGRVPYAAAAIAVSTDTLVDEGGDDPNIGGTGEGKDGIPAEPTTTAATQEEEESSAQPTATGVATYYYPTVTTVKYTYAELTAVQEEILTLDVPGAPTMHTAYVDAARNRVVVTVASVDDALRQALTDRYGAEKVAIEVNAEEVAPAQTARHNDTSPFFGGARTTTSSCTTGFAWKHEGVPYLVTAGHCVSLHQNYYMPVPHYAVGKVTSDNWDTIRGTVKFPSQSYYAGDLGLVRLAGGNNAAPYVYTANATSNTRREVAGPWSRAPRRGDKYCTGGATTGELCGWTVSQTGVTVKYSSGGVARNMVKGSKTGRCTAAGDSGGPIYTVRSDGKIVAKGINSGGGGGGSNNYGGTFDPCRDYFTDIRLAEKAMPGIVKKY
ncbi:trypsin-like serine protease [Nonomuraea sp. 10N515B]|uniref:trypsin-like serine protease n=1 Tax=Nonomuraea sp. 10N515B TaxID=3457422 RepID=UPI003FCD4FA4